MNTESDILERRVGTTLRGKWKLERLLGVGGMAAVYVGVHKIGRRDAIKILHHEIAENKDLAARFEQEAHAVNRLRHPGAVEILDIDVAEDGAPFLVMELLEGESIEDRIQRQLIGVAETLRIADELLDVLAAAHDHGIVHRDIKPDNLFLLRDGRLKVLDFGIARMRQGATKLIHTQAGVAIGTLSYMPPEQVAGAEIDGRADLFAVGCTMFRLVTGRSPHEGGTELELMVKMAMEPAPPLASLAPSLPRELCVVIDRALAFERERRYPDARTMQQDVRAVRAGRVPPHAAARLAAGDVPNPGRPDEAALSGVRSGLIAATVPLAAMGSVATTAPVAAMTPLAARAPSTRPPLPPTAPSMPMYPPMGMPPMPAAFSAAPTSMPAPRAPQSAPPPSMAAPGSWAPPSGVSYGAQPRTLVGMTTPSRAVDAGTAVGGGSAASRRARDRAIAILMIGGLFAMLGVAATIWWSVRSSGDDAGPVNTRPLAPRPASTPTPISVDPPSPAGRGVPPPGTPTSGVAPPPTSPASARPTGNVPRAPSPPAPANTPPVPFIPSLPPAPALPAPPTSLPPVSLPRIPLPRVSPPPVAPAPPSPELQPRRGIPR